MSSIRSRLEAEEADLGRVLRAIERHGPCGARKLLSYCRTPAARFHVVVKRLEQQGKIRRETVMKQFIPRTVYRLK